MARSGLVDRLRQAYKIIQISACTDTPLSEIEGRWQATLSRRQMLGTIALAGLVGSSPHTDRSRNPLLPDDYPFHSALSTESRVLIVGAGIAGLTAAYRLRQAGVAVDVVEALPQVGGRLRSLTNVVACPTPVELGGEFIDTRHTHVRSLAAELGLEMADLKAADLGLEPEILYFQGDRLSHDQVVQSFSPLATYIARDLAKLNNRIISYHHPSPDAVRLDQLSLAEYLAAAPGDQVIKDLVRVAYVTEFGRDATDQSCLNMLFLIGAEAGQWNTYGVSDERWHVKGGNDSIPKRLAERVNNAIEPSTVLESIRLESEGRYRVGLRSDASSIERVYERILLTVPFSVLRQVELAVEMAPVKQRAIAELGYGTGTKLVTPYRERIWRHRYGSTVSIYTDRDFQNTWESARYAEGVGGWVTDLRGGTQGLLLGKGDPETHAQGLATDLEAIFPGISQIQRGRAIRAFWSAESYALGSYSCYLPGQWTAFGGVEGERVGNIWFAGEHCSMGSQGYMNGACETAEIAALNILKDLGVTAAVATQSHRIMTNRKAAMAIS